MANPNSTVRVRFAPSPTGFLHVGGLRTALFNYLFAKKHGGKFILRIEDTDKNRIVKGALENIIEILFKFRLVPDEGPQIPKGKYGPYIQSQRLGIYQKCVQELINKGTAYKCYCSNERIAELKKQADAQKQSFRYDKHCLKNPPSPQPSPIKGEERVGGYVIRQNIPEEGKTEFTDLVYGNIEVQNRLLDDGILLKSDGSPVYNLANVIDDHLMNITHVIRGEEFIPSTPKHILLYQAFGWQLPQFAHLPLILDKERKKLSKRTGDITVKEYLEKGYLPEAILNFIAFLGWNPKTEKEIFSLEELIQEFDLKKVNKAGAIFDLGKLDFINREWQKRLNLGARDPMYERTKKLLEEKFGNLTLSPSPKSERVGERLGTSEEKFFNKIWPLIQERIKGPSDLEDKLPEFYFFFREPIYEADLLMWAGLPDIKIKKWPGEVPSVKATLQKLYDFYKQLDVTALTASDLNNKTFDFIKEQGIGVGDTLWPLRVALTGLRASPGPFEILEAFLILPNGKEIILSRIQTAIAKLENL